VAGKRRSVRPTTALQTEEIGRAGRRGPGAGVGEPW